VIKKPPRLGGQKKNKKIILGHFFKNPIKGYGANFGRFSGKNKKKKKFQDPPPPKGDHLFFFFGAPCIKKKIFLRTFLRGATNFCWGKILRAGGGGAYILRGGKKNGKKKFYWDFFFTGTCEKKTKKGPFYYGKGAGAYCLRRKILAKNSSKTGPHVGLFIFWGTYCWCLFLGKQRERA